MIAVPAGELTTLVGEYLREKTGVTLQEGMYSALMVLNDRQDFVAAVAITNYRGMDCELTCAGETPMAWRPHVCRAVFTYIFNQLNCVRCTASTTKANKRTRRFLKGLGFTLEGNLRRGYDGRRDALIYGMLASECRFLTERSEDLINEKYTESAYAA